MQGITSVFEYAVRAFNNQFVFLGILYTADNLCVNAEALAYGDNLFSMLRFYIYLQTVPHVEYFVHLGPIGTALLLDGLEERWYGEKVVFDNSLVFHKVHYFGLCTARAVYHSMDFGTQSVKHLLYNRCVCPCGREYKLACVKRRAFYCVCKLETT